MEAPFYYLVLSEKLCNKIHFNEIFRIQYLLLNIYFYLMKRTKVFRIYIVHCT